MRYEVKHMQVLMKVVFFNAFSHRCLNTFLGWTSLFALDSTWSCERYPLWRGKWDKRKLSKWDMQPGKETLRKTAQKINKNIMSVKDNTIQTTLWHRKLHIYQYLLRN